MTKKQARIRKWAMQMMDAYYVLGDVENIDEVEDAKKNYKRCLNNLSYNTGKDKDLLEWALLTKRSGGAYNLDWLRGLGMDI